MPVILPSAAWPSWLGEDAAEPEADRHRRIARFGPMEVGSWLWRRLSLEGLVARGKADPVLFASGPDVPGRPQPGGVVKRAGADADHPVTRRAGEPGAAFRAHHRVLTRPLSAMRCSGRGSTPLR